jgi:hypothetical protein
MENVLVPPFLRLLGAYGPLVALVVVALLVGIILAFLYGRAKINMMAEDQRQRARERELEEQERLREGQARERERTELITEIKAARTRLEALVGQQHVLMTNHLEHDRQEREALVKILTEQSIKTETTMDTMDGLREAISGLRLQIAAGLGKNGITT